MDSSAIIVNEFVGAESYGSEETFPVFASGSRIDLGLKWCVNPNSTNETDQLIENCLARTLQLELKSRLWELKNKTGNDYENISDSIAINHITALTKVWLLTRKVPKKYCASAGDGVLVNKKLIDQNLKDIDIEIQLITLRGGLSDVDLSYGEFVFYLKNLIETPVVLRDIKDSDLYITHPFNKARYEFWGGHPVNLFSEAQIHQGVSKALQDL